jgi:hypothetical protein
MANNRMAQPWQDIPLAVLRSVLGSAYDRNIETSSTATLGTRPTRFPTNAGL